jgi:hypothetical protein
MPEARPGIFFLNIAMLHAPPIVFLFYRMALFYFFGSQNETPQELPVGVGLEMHADAEAEVSAMGVLQEGNSDKDPTEALLHRSMCEFDEICRAQHLLMNMQCFDLAGTSGDEAKLCS